MQIAASLPIFGGKLLYGCLCRHFWENYVCDRRSSINDELLQEKKKTSSRRGLGIRDDYDTCNGVSMSMPRGDCTRSACFLAAADDNNKALMLSGLSFRGEPQEKSSRHQKRITQHGRH
jgi:hypothetical protein